jgi:peptidoglycan/LPS O-acetylase OafA/YrhL
VLFAWAARQRDWATMRIAALPELSVAVLLLIATQLHLDKFHSDLFGYFWVAVYAVATPVLIYLFAATRTGADASRGQGRLPMPGPLRLALGLQAAAFAIYGAGLFVWPSGFDAAWPWELTPLTGRAIAAFLLGFAVAAAIALRTNSVRRFRGAALTYATLGGLELLAAALHSSDFRAGPSLPLFVAFFASVLAVGAAGLAPGRTGGQSSDPSRASSALSRS